MMKIRVPATSANLGPGFDSCGIALGLYLELELISESEAWFIEHSLDADIPHDETNMIITTALSIEPGLKPHHLKMTTDIPPARGLGSSSSAIVAGIELADLLGGLHLSAAEKINLATRLEGHPDNVVPAVCGDFIVASFDGKEVQYVKHHFPECDILVYIPEEHLLTSESRNVLPDKLDYSEAVLASSISNVMIAAILNDDLCLAGKMMEKDLWHEKYRTPLLPHMAQIKKIARDSGAFGSVLSGAGPTVLILSPKEKTRDMMNLLKKYSEKAKILQLAVERSGTQII